MADIEGISLRLKVEDVEGGGVFTTVAAAITDTISIANSTVEVNTKDSLGWRDLFPSGAIKSVEFSASFQFTNTADQQRIRSIAMADDSSANFLIPDGTGEEWAGRFQLTAYEETGETEGFLQANISLSSTGIIVLQPET